MLTKPIVARRQRWGFREMRNKRLLGEEESLGRDGGRQEERRKGRAASDTADLRRSTTIGRLYLQGRNIYTLH